MSWNASAFFHPASEVASQGSLMRCKIFRSPRLLFCVYSRGEKYHQQEFSKGDDSMGPEFLHADAMCSYCRRTSQLAVKLCLERVFSTIPVNVHEIYQLDSVSTYRNLGNSFWIVKWCSCFYYATRCNKKLFIVCDCPFIFQVHSVCFEFFISLRFCLISV